MAPHRVSVAILALVLSFLATLIGLRIVALNEERAGLLARAELSMRTLALVTEQYTERVFETSDLVTTEVAAWIASRGGVAAVRDSQPLHAFLRDLSERSAGDYLMVVDAAGRPVSLSDRFPAPSEVDLSDRRWFRAHAVEGHATHLGDALQSRITGEILFTTKGVGRGSGLGLSMVQGLAQQSGGGLRLDSRPGEGTVAALWLPCAELGALAEATPPPRPIPGTTPPRRVLVVDDDPLVAAGTAMMLEDMGHLVTTAASAQDALALFEREAPPDIVVTDHAMPGMTGLELAEWLRRTHPGLPVVLATGYAEATGNAAPWLPRLAKPYRQDELEDALRRLTRCGHDYKSI
ncbi:MAG: response regulator [Roseomonas sp.]|nr:response regulator [Roseomonas sp.]